MSDSFAGQGLYSILSQPVSFFFTFKISSTASLTSLSLDILAKNTTRLQI